MTPLPRVTFYFFKCLFIRLVCSEMWNEQVIKYLIKTNLAFKPDFLLPKTIINSVSRGKKSLCDILSTPLKCHVLFEWPYTTLFLFFSIEKKVKQSSSLIRTYLFSTLFLSEEYKKCVLNSDTTAATTTTTTTTVTTETTTECGSVMVFWETTKTNNKVWIEHDATSKKLKQLVNSLN